jgi:hypothetical protein
MQGLNLRPLPCAPLLPIMWHVRPRSASSDFRQPRGTISMGPRRILGCRSSNLLDLSTQTRQGVLVLDAVVARLWATSGFSHSVLTMASMSSVFLLWIPLEKGRGCRPGHWQEF